MECIPGKSGTEIYAIHIESGKEWTFISIKEMANTLGLGYESIRQKFRRQKSNVIEFKGYRIEKKKPRSDSQALSK